MHPTANATYIRTVLITWLEKGNIDLANIGVLEEVDESGSDKAANAQDTEVTNQKTNENEPTVVEFVTISDCDEPNDAEITTWSDTDAETDERELKVSHDHIPHGLLFSSHTLATRCASVIFNNENEIPKLETTSVNTELSGSLYSRSRWVAAYVYILHSLLLISFEA